jgi:uncharacterized protein with NRDE domain
MCTITFIPFSPQKYVLVNIRDENISRKRALFPFTKTVREESWVYPQDAEAGGSWLAFLDSGKINMLINGAFEIYKRKPPYRKSRGLVLLDSLSHKSILNYESKDNLKNIEPFTIISFSNLLKKEIEEFRWDGNKGYSTTLKSESPHLWSSTYIYAPELHQKKVEAFNLWLKKEKEFTEKSILKFHKSKESNFLLNKNDFLSVSITYIEVDHEEEWIKVVYEDISQKISQRLILSLKQKS